MFKPRVAATTLALAALLSASTAHTAETDCFVEPFTGAALPQGATARMRVVSNGKPCRIINFGVSAERRNPSDSGTITQAPTRGKAEFIAPRAVYTPDPGFVGDDEFAYEAHAKGNVDQQIRLRVRVLVSVVAP